MRLPAALCKMQRKKRETDGFSKSTLMTPPGSHPTSGFGARHGLPKFFGHKKRRIVQNDAAKTKVSSVDIPTGWDPPTKQQRRVALADFSAAPWRGFEKSERGPNSSSLFQPLAAVVAVAPGWLRALPAAGPRCSNPSRSQSQRVTYVHAKEKQQRNNYAAAKSGPRGIRTLDLSDANRTLSQLSYRPIATIRTAPLARNRSDRFYLVRVARIELTAS